MSSNLSTQLRLAQTRNTGSLPVPAPVAVQLNTRTHVSEQIPAATIAHHTDYENTRNLQRSPWLSTVNTFIPCGLAISSRGRTFLCATTTTVEDLDSSCKWPKSRHFIDADIQPHFILLFVTDDILWYIKQKAGIGE